MAILDICICSFNRSTYLKRCLDAIVPQILPAEAEIIIIDNASTDDTSDLIRKYTSHPFIKSFIELKSGLSYARNRGWIESNSEWILYIDDDCLPRPSFVDNALALLKNQPSELAIGGPIYPIFEHKPPEWFPEGFGQFTMPFETYTVISNGYIRGGCMMIKRSFLEINGGFNPDLGVHDKKLRYGEELELQEKIKRSGGTIGYAPTLAIDHFVRAEKVSASWLLHSEYARRRDKMKITPLPLLPLSLKLVLTFIKTLVILPAYWMRSLVDKNYSAQRAKLDALKPLMFRTGEWWGVISRKKTPGQTGL